MSDQTLSTGDRQIARGASVVMIGLAISSVVGLLTTILVSQAFGTQADLDAFYAANRLPEFIFLLMAGGALASAFVPTFTGFLARRDVPGAWKLASAVGNLVAVVLVLACLLAAVGARWLVMHVIAPGFTDADQIATTTHLMRILLIAPTIFGISGLLMGVLNAHQRFLLPALAPALYRFGWILGLWLLVPRMGIAGLAWGVVLGAGLHLAVQLPGLLRLSPTYSPTLGRKNPAVYEVGRLMVPRLLGVAVVQINFLVNTILASGMSEGSLAALTFAFTLMIMPQAVIGQGSAIAALPTFSEQAARGQMEILRASLGNTLRAVNFLALPASVGLILLRVPIVEALFQRGAFGAESTDMVAWALLWFAAGLVGHSLLEVISRAFYAMHDTRTPVLVGVAAMSLNILLSLGLTWVFVQIDWMPHGALALANSLATALECLVLLGLMRQRLLGLEGARLRRGLQAAIAAASVMALTLSLWMRFTAGWSAIAVAGGGVLLGMAVYLAVASAMRAPEPLAVWRTLARRRAARS
jgi:putative peptidoglycan lipid II flippase